VKEQGGGGGYERSRQKEECTSLREKERMCGQGEDCMNDQIGEECS
jgi:hypothetical protein